MKTKRGFIRFSRESSQILSTTRQSRYREEGSQGEGRAEALRLQVTLKAEQISGGMLCSVSRYISNLINSFYI